MVVDTLFLKRLYLFFVIDVSNRQIVLFNITANPTAIWLEIVVRCGLSSLENIPKILVSDRNGIYGEWFGDFLDSFEVWLIRTPPRTPNCYAFIERWHRSLREEALDHCLVFGKKDLCKVVGKYVRCFILVLTQLTGAHMSTTVFILVFLATLSIMSCKSTGQNANELGSLGFTLATSYHDSIGFISSEEDGSNHGTGFVVALDNEYVYILTNAHVHGACVASDTGCSAFFTASNNSSVETFKIAPVKYEGMDVVLNSGSSGVAGGQYDFALFRFEKSRKRKFTALTLFRGALTSATPYQSKVVGFPGSVTQPDAITVERILSESVGVTWPFGDSIQIKESSNPREIIQFIDPQLLKTTAHIRSGSSGSPVFASLPNGQEVVIGIVFSGNYEDQTAIVQVGSHKSAARDANNFVSNAWPLKPFLEHFSKLTIWKNAKFVDSLPLESMFSQIPMTSKLVRLDEEIVETISLDFTGQNTESANLFVNGISVPLLEGYKYSDKIITFLNPVRQYNPDRPHFIIERRDGKKISTAFCYRLQKLSWPSKSESRIDCFSKFEGKRLFQ